MKVKGKDLEFISQIKRDGSGVMLLSGETKHMDETIFNVECLSITYKTYIAMEFNSFVVKLKSITTNIKQ